MFLASNTLLFCNRAFLTILLFIESIFIDFNPAKKELEGVTCNGKYSSSR